MTPEVFLAVSHRVIAPHYHSLRRSPTEQNTFDLNHTDRNALFRHGQFCALERDRQARQASSKTNHPLSPPPLLCYFLPIVPYTGYTVDGKEPGA